MYINVSHSSLMAQSLWSKKNKFFQTLYRLHKNLNSNLPLDSKQLSKFACQRQIPACPGFKILKFH